MTDFTNPYTNMAPNPLEYAAQGYQRGLAIKEARQNADFKDMQMREIGRQIEAEKQKEKLSVSGSIAAQLLDVVNQEAMINGGGDVNKVLSNPQSAQKIQAAYAQSAATLFSKGLITKPQAEEMLARPIDMNTLDEVKQTYIQSVGVKNYEEMQAKANKERMDRVDAKRKQEAEFGQAKELKQLEIDAKAAAEDIKFSRDKELERIKNDAGNKPPPGYEKDKTTGGLKAIPGGPADLKKTEQYRKDVAAYDATSSQYDKLINSAKELMNHPGLPGIVGLRGSIPDIPGTDAANARAVYDNMDANGLLQTMAVMKGQSPTGATGMGALSDKEGMLLRASAATLGRKQDEASFRRNLKKYIETLETSKQRMARGISTIYGENVDLAGTSDKRPPLSDFGAP